MSEKEKKDNVASTEEVVEPKVDDSVSATNAGASSDVAESALSKRDAFMERMRGYYPDFDGDWDDEDTFYGKLSERADEYDRVKGDFDTLNGSNEKLVQVVGEDPRFAEFIGMVAHGEHLMYALGKVFGNIVDKVDDDSLEQYRKGQSEYKAGIASMRENFGKYEATLEEFCKENDLSEEDGKRINDTILDIVDSLNAGLITKDIISEIWKGLDYDNEKAAEIEAAKLAGKNEAIDAVKSKKSAKTPLPDLGGGKTNSRTPLVFEREKKPKSFSDAIREQDV